MLMGYFVGLFDLDWVGLDAQLYIDKLNNHVYLYDMLNYHIKDIPHSLAVNAFVLIKNISTAVHAFRGERGRIYADIYNSYLHRYINIGDIEEILFPP